MIGVLLGCLATFFMVGNEKIFERFMTTFASAEERDQSAESRLTYWEAALTMIVDYPAGSGAEAAFKSNRGVRYLNRLTSVEDFRAVHNGHLDIAAAWGLQGYSLFLLTIALMWRRLSQRRKQATSRNDERAAFLGVSLEAAMVTQFIACFFISSLDGEWFFWWFALVVCYDRFFSADLAVVEQRPHQDQLRVA
ncbi:MAG: O-antigen ligase family protein [Pirellulales bacterium]|nr:O-antigen ligase family protein [Pirellulales bacterium]